MTADTDYIAMFLLGLLGSGHCIGMCGPLVVALPGRFACWYAHVIYHAGRVTTYTVVGGLLGGLRQGILWLADATPDSALDWTGRAQLFFSLLAAGCLLMMGFNRVGLAREPAWMAQGMPQRIPGFDVALKRTLDRRNVLSLLLMGLMLGFLPCGLSYGAFSRALAAKGPVQGALMAASFGVGTLPALLLLGTGVIRLLRRYRMQTELLAGLLMIAMGAGLIGDALGALF
ncbi:MAG: sulfite exporter TauE/SafE family protein [Desulfatitalea sp.]|nr:sulfite exporter TauE/SafE family protein [Desulfatitalea sp.]NNK02232.1 sulfite exporter TauE/SafE family protein [Desulfatitalea sp.]